MNSGKSGNKGFSSIDKIIAVLVMAVLLISLLLGYRVFALGVALAVIVAWILYRWQMTAVFNAKSLSSRKATNRLIIRSMIKLLVFLIMIGLSSLGGRIFLFGVLTGLSLQVAAYIGQSFLIYKGTPK